MSARMNNSEYIEKAKALVEAKKQYYLTLSELSRFSSDEESAYDQMQKMSHFLRSVMDYGKRGEDIPLSLFMNLGGVEDVHKEVYYSPKAFYREFLSEMLDGVSTDNAYTLFEYTRVFLLLRPFMRTVEFIKEHKFNDSNICESEMIKALLSLEEDKDNAKECLSEYLIPFSDGEKDIPKIEEAVALLMELNAIKGKSLVESIGPITTLFEKMVEWLQTYWNKELLEYLRLTDREAEILQPFIKDPELSKYIGLDRNEPIQFELPEDYFKGKYLYDSNSIGEMDKKYRDPNKLAKLINYFAEKGYIDNDINTKRTLAFRLTGMNKPDYLIEKIIWHDKPNPLCYCVKVFTDNYDKFKMMEHLFYFEAGLVNPSDKAENCKKFQKDFNSIFE